MKRDQFGNIICNEQFLRAEDGEGRTVIFDRQTEKKYYGTMDFKEVWI